MRHVADSPHDAQGVRSGPQNLPKIDRTLSAARTLRAGRNWEARRETLQPPRCSEGQKRPGKSLAQVAASLADACRRRRGEGRPMNQRLTRNYFNGKEAGSSLSLYFNRSDLHRELLPSACQDEGIESRFKPDPRHPRHRRPSAPDPCSLI